MSGNKWIEPIEEFTLTQRNLPHMQTPGGYYFTASNTWHRRELDEWERDLIFETILLHNGTKYILEAAVVMPDHFHLILKPLLKVEASYYSLAEIFHSIKSYTAKQIAARDRELSRVARAALGTGSASEGTRAEGGTSHASTSHASTSHASTSHASTSHASTSHASTSHASTSHASAGHASASHATRRKRGVQIYQDENYDHIIRNERDYNEKLNYLVMNPVEAGLVERPEDYRWLYCPSIGKVGL
jgi:REP element-mobilizing transposase RayT